LIVRPAGTVSEKVIGPVPGPPLATIDDTSARLPTEALAGDAAVATDASWSV
jgi:hypothetical protein